MSLRSIPVAALIFALSVPALAAPALAAGSLVVTYPSPNYTTSSEQIFFIGTAPTNGPVTINGVVVERSPAGHFGPSFPLAPGQNVFVVQYGSETQTFHIKRIATEAVTPIGATFVKGSMMPLTDLTRQPGESALFSAIAAPGAHVSVRIAGQDHLLSPEPVVELPDNKAALTQKNQPHAHTTVRYESSFALAAPGRYGHPVYTIELGGRRASATAPGTLEVLDPQHLQVAHVKVEAAIARTGPSTDFSRLTPLPKGVQALVTGSDGDWLRLDYGAWIAKSEVELVDAPAPPHSVIRSIGAKQEGPWTTVAFPLQAPVPLSITEGAGTFTLTLYGATAQTDIIRIDRDPLIDWLGWTQAAPDRIDYVFHLKGPHAWGYKLAYEGTTLKLSLRHAPEATPHGRPLEGLRIVLDPGHGGPDDPGTSGPDGTHEKTLTLIVAKQVRDRLRDMGCDVVITREADVSLGLKERQDIIVNAEPALSVSLHYNALPDNGDVLHTKGVGAFWYNPQAQPLAAFMQRYLVEHLGRPSYGLFWDNLALTRPTIAPTILIELGFLTSPTESEWATSPDEQRRLAEAIADGLAAYIKQAKPVSDDHP